jgi:hypothetical protein
MTLAGPLVQAVSDAHRATPGIDCSDPQRRKYRRATTNASEAVALALRLRTTQAESQMFTTATTGTFKAVMSIGRPPGFGSDVRKGNGADDFGHPHVATSDIDNSGGS